MKRLQPSSFRIRTWHSVMYATGYLLLLCGLLGTCLLLFILRHQEVLKWPDAIRISVLLFVSEAAIAGLLLMEAKWIKVQLGTEGAWGESGGSLITLVPGTDGAVHSRRWTRVQVWLRRVGSWSLGESSSSRLLGWRRQTRW
jgi:hypothetical protein